MEEGGRGGKRGEELEAETGALLWSQMFSGSSRCSQEVTSEGLPPFQPPRTISRKFLSLKTVFLLALASGRRGSEIHALSGRQSDSAFEHDGSVSL